MQFEYLIFNIIVFSGPFVFGLLKPFYFVHRWMYTLISIIVVGIPFIIWDAIVTGTHWMFNDQYIIGLKYFNLPVEEWLFFVTVPFACMYTWEMISQRSTDKQIDIMKPIRKWLYVLPVPGMLLFISGLEYTGLVFIFLAIAILVDALLGTDLILQKRFLIYVAMIFGFTLLFNGFLTWRPVVLYGESYQIGLRIFTIPIEDFGYGLSLLYLNTSIFEKLKSVNFSFTNVFSKRLVPGNPVFNSASIIEQEKTNV